MDDRDIYFFDLQGFLHLPSALSENEVGELNDCIDGLLPLSPGEWYGYMRACRPMSVKRAATGMASTPSRAAFTG